MSHGPIVIVPDEVIRALESYKRRDYTEELTAEVRRAIFGGSIGTGKTEMMYSYISGHSMSELFLFQEVRRDLPKLKTVFNHPEGCPCC